MTYSVKERVRRMVSVLGLSLGLIWSSSVAAYDLPGVNLGLTSFLDGARALGRGWYYHQYFQYYSADKFSDQDGKSIRLPTGDAVGRPRLQPVKLDTWVVAAQVAYQSGEDALLGGRWGVETLLPFISLDRDPDDVLVPFEANGIGVGDLFIGPYLQWETTVGEGGPVTWNRFSLQALLPTGKYDDDKEINQGGNVFGFNPYWASTLFLSDAFSVSWRLHYLWVGENDDPNRHLFPPAVERIQGGQAIHANFAAAYRLLPMLRVGMNGYVLKQITDTKIDGEDVKDRREQVFAVGPGAMVHISDDTHMFFNAYVEMDAENRTEGNRFNVQFMVHF